MKARSSTLTCGGTSAITGLTSIGGVSLDASGNVYIAFISSSVLSLRKYNSGLASQWLVNLAGTTVRHIASDGTSVFAPSSSGAFVYKRLASTGASGSPTDFGVFGPGGPIGLVADGTSVWVVDTGNNRVQKFTASSGAFVSDVDGSSSGLAFSGPTGIAIGPTATHLYVLDPVNGRVVKFLKSTHAFVATFAVGTGTADGQISTTAEGIALDVTGRIWISDTGNHRIQVFDSAGAFLGKIGSFGSGDAQFKSPKQLVFNAAGDTAYVADSGNGRLVTLQEDLGQITPVITTRSNSGSGGNNTNISVDVTCNAGEVVVGGGHQNSNVGINMVVAESYPPSNTTWRCNVRNTTGGSASVTCYARCLKSPL
jgi:tripartite motif-containing protein 71